MGDHLIFGKRLKPSESDKPVLATYLGQAHFAGTGPAGTTCRECVYWYNIDENAFRKTPAFYSATNEDHPLEPKKQRCNRPIANKANRLIPHYAPSCRLFEPQENPTPARKPDK